MNLVLMLWTYKRLCLDTTLTAESEGKGRSTPPGPLHEVVGEDLVNALPGFHALSGCDQTGTILGGYSHTLPILVCAAQRGRDFEAPDLERGIHFRGVL